MVIPTRNSSSTLPALLRSVRAQDYPDVEIIVVDNGSTDGTQRIAEDGANHAVQAGPERSAQRNRGAELASGEYLLFLDADMSLERSVVSACVSEQGRTQASAIVVPERTIGSGFLAKVRALERSCYVGDETIEAARFFTADAFRRHGGYDVALTGVEDWDLPARIRAAGERQSRIASSFIDHDETGIRLNEHLRKKYYYAKTAGPYLRRHRGLASKQVVLLRPAFLRHRSRLARTPILAGALVGLKLAEAASGAAGLASAMLRLPRSRLPERRSE